MQKQKNKKLFYVVIVAVLMVFIGVIIIFCFQSNNNKKIHVKNDNIYETNSNGQTYGHAETTSFDQIPDLTPAIGKNHIEGYMRKEDLLGEHNEEYDIYNVDLTDYELELARKQYKNQFEDVTKIKFYKKCFDVPLFDVSGENVVDQFTITIGYYPYLENE